MSVEAVDSCYHLPPPDVDTKEWRHNPLHDLDSIWWLSVWATVFFRDKQARPKEYDREIFQALFSQSRNRRDDLFQHPKKLRTMNLSYNCSIWSVLQDWRLELSMLFYRYETELHAWKQLPPERAFDEGFELTFKHLRTILSLDGIRSAVVKWQPL